MLANEM
jgi:hypothetical protein